jgi:4-methyl-5(b-hydroxyethyl)-thiazole monophosphate biosynthesis
MKTILVHLATGFEEMEALVPVDVWRRAGFDIQTVSIMGNKIVTGAHNISVVADLLFDEVDYDYADMIFLPGGMPGASNLDAHKGLQKKILEFNRKGKYLAAICAAPLVLGHNNLLKNKRATCFPGFEKELYGATITGSNVEFDDNIITAKGAGVAFELAMKVTEMFKGRDFTMQLAAKMQVSPNVIP